MTTIRRLLPARVLHKLEVTRDLARENRELLDALAHRLGDVDRVWNPIADRLIPRPLTLPDEYERWCQATLDNQDRAAIRSFCADLVHQPVISIVMAIHKPKLSVLAEAIDSVRQQAYENWQLCLVDDASEDTELTHVLARWALKDSRIDLSVRAKRGNAVSAYNDGIALAYGEYVTFLDHDDLLPSDALAWIVAWINRQPSSRLLYTDDDQLSATGERVNPYFKPDWDPELLLGQNYINHLLVIERATLTRLEGFREGTDGVQDWDLALRASEILANDAITHVPTIGYHWRNPPGAKSPLSTTPETLEAATAVVSDAMQRRGIKGTIEPLNALMRRVHRTPIDYPSVAILVIDDPESTAQRLKPQTPDAETLDGLTSTLDSIIATNYSNRQILVLTQPHDPKTRSRINEVVEDANQAMSQRVAPRAAPSGDGPNGGEARHRIELIECKPDATTAATVNAIIASIDADYICLISNACRVINADWLHEMVGIAAGSDVGVVGGLVTYPNGRIHNAGVAIGVNNEIGYRYHLEPGLSTGHRDRLLINQRVAGVTGGALVVNRQRYLEVGGLDPYYDSHLGDIDLCLRLASVGYHCYFTPMAQFLRHRDPQPAEHDAAEHDNHEARIEGDEHRRFSNRWLLDHGVDPYYHPQLCTATANFFPERSTPFGPPWSHPIRWHDLPLASPERYFSIRWRRLEPAASIDVDLPLEGATKLRLWLDLEPDADFHLDLIDPDDNSVVATFTKVDASSQLIIANIQSPGSGSGQRPYRIINRHSVSVAIAIVAIDEHTEVVRIGLGRPL